ncbi:MAG: hypothetical protein ABI947_00040 [Chloroflexota bacterium]
MADLQITPPAAETVADSDSNPRVKTPSLTKPRRFGLRPWMVVLTLCVLYLLFIFLSYRNGIREFIWPTPSGKPGYDGQFTYAIALDPANAAQYLDVPAYRYQRILHPLLARLLALGQESLIPYAMLAINLIGLGLGTAAFERLLLAERINRWFALTYGLFGGVFFAVRVNTSEPLAFGLVLLAILAEQRKRGNWQAILLLLAAFAKETTLFFVAGYLIYDVLERRWRDVFRLTLIVVVPFVVWQIVLKVWLGQFGIGSGGAGATPFEVIPFNGIWRLAQYGFTIFAVLGLILIPFAVLPTLWALWRGGRDALQQRWHPYVFLMLANAAILPFVPFSTYREPLGIARFLVGLVITVVLYAALRKARRVLRYSTLWTIFGFRLFG